MNRLIAKIEKTAGEEIRITLRPHRAGRTLIDIRTYYKPSDEGEAVPTRAGITLAPELFPALKKACLTLEKTLEEHRLPP